ncbi:MAG: toll/interleukin-1 receptor domain-containing protein [Actinomycetota bacterium]|nr:toll/interleukin-1 receptor domain-containing protein [Actinomycetota bacterium]
MAFDAFISYSHAADGRLAPALQQAMQRLAKPWYRARALRVFRDESALSANPHLWSSIQTAMDESEWFVLLASPDAVASEWVNREVDYWLSIKSSDRLLVVVTDGTLEWNDGGLSGTAVPAALRSAFTDEPRHVDLRWAASETDLDMHNARFRDVVAQLAAPMHNMARDDLDSEDVRQHRHARRLARGGVTVLALLLVVALVAAGLAVAQRRDANRAKGRAEAQTVIADSGRLAALATNYASNQLHLALLLAVEGHRLRDSSATRSGLASVLQASPHLVSLHGGFGQNVTAVAISPDRARIAVADRSGKLRLWSLPAIKPLTAAIAASHARIVDVAWSANGRLIATGGDGGSRVWDAATLRPVGPLHPEGTGQVAISSDGRQLYSNEYGSNGSGLYPGRSGQSREALPGLNATFSPDGRRIAVPVEGTVELQGIDGRTPEGPPGRPTPEKTLVVDDSSEPTASAFSADGSKLAVGTASGRVTMFDVATGRSMWQKVAGHAGRVSINRVAFSPDGNVVATGDSDGRVIRWNAATGDQFGAPLIGVTGPVMSVAVISADDIVAAGTSNVATWSIANFTVHRSENVNGSVAQIAGVSGGPVYDYGDMAVAPGGLVALIDVGYKVRLWNVAHSEPQSVNWLTLPPSDSLVSIALDSDGSHLALANYTNPENAVGIRLWSVRDHSKLGTVSAETIPSTSPDPFNRERPFRVVFSRDGRYLAYVGRNFELYTVPRLTRVRFPAAGSTNTSDRATAIAFSPDSRTLAVAGTDDVIRLWDVRTGAERWHSAHTEATIDDLAFAPDGSRFVSASDGNVQVWDAKTGRQLSPPLPAGSGQLHGITISSDGTMLAIISTNGELTLRDLVDYQQIGPRLIADSDAPARPASFGSGPGTGLAEFLPDDTTLVTTSPLDGHVYLWDISPASWEHKACQLAGRNLTRDEWRQYLGDRPYRKTC